ncbi:heterokaryon incompatibility protein-domain-containing protein, partial [Colletotrichum cereale]
MLTTRAKRRIERKVEEAYPSRHCWLPTKKREGHPHDPTDSDSEDTTVDRGRILPQRFRVDRSGEAKYVDSKEDAATTVELHEIMTSQPALAPHSCSHCKEWEIDFRHFRLNYRGSPDLSQGHQYPGPEGGFTARYAQEKARLGCDFFQRAPKERRSSFQSRQKKELNGDEAAYVRVQKDTNIKMIFHLAWKGPDADGYGEVYEVYSAADDQPRSGALIGHLPPNLVSDSELSYRRIKRWMHECQRSHSKCSSRSNKFVPTRLLHVSGTPQYPKIKLSTEPPIAPYATLSYCWGGDQDAKTLRSNFESYQDHIEFSTLPSTIQDAAIVTIQIGLSYLWVDAMCIIQDDDNDKMKEIAKMHAIYRSSRITIAPSEAATSNTGFLRPRDMWRPIKMKARFDENVFSDVLLVPEGDSCRPSAALFQRGWTLQETLLSTRVLVYGLRELTFLCLEGIRSECGSHLTVEEINWAFHPGSTIHVNMNHPQSWSYLIASYSQRFLTVEDDKLLGIAALAEEYGRSKGVDGYFAGLWRDKFLEQALWTTASYTGSPKHSKGYIAPSWSWASVNGEITGFGASFNMPLVWLPETMPNNIACELIDVKTTLKTPENPFGMVSDGYMLLRGNLRRVIWKSEHGRGSAWNGVGCLTSNTKERLEAREKVFRDPRMAIRMDHQQDWLEGDLVLLWSLEICKTDEGQGYALLLEETEAKAGAFRRVGRLEITSVDESRGNWFDSEYMFREVMV